jgi:hypothetical protein
MSCASKTPLVPTASDPSILKGTFGGVLVDPIFLEAKRINNTTYDVTAKGDHENLVSAGWLYAANYIAAGRNYQNTMKMSHESLTFMDSGGILIKRIWVANGRITIR